MPPPSASTPIAPVTPSAVEPGRVKRQPSNRMPVVSTRDAHAGMVSGSPVTVSQDWPSTTTTVSIRPPSWKPLPW